MPDSPTSRYRTAYAQPNSATAPEPQPGRRPTGRRPSLWRMTDIGERRPACPRRRRWRVSRSGGRRRGRRRARTRLTGPRIGRTYTRSTHLRPPYPVHSISDTCSPSPTPTWWHGSSGCAARPCSTRSAGTTTGCPPSGGCRTTSACGATRRCRTTRLHPPDEARPEAPGADLPAQLRRAVRATDHRGRAGVRGAVAPARAELRLVAPVHDHRRRTPAPPRSGRSCATSPAARPTRPRRRRCGT